MNGTRPENCGCPIRTGIIGTNGVHSFKQLSLQLFLQKNQRGPSFVQQLFRLQFQPVPPLPQRLAQLQLSIRKHQIESHKHYRHLHPPLILHPLPSDPLPQHRERQRLLRGVIPTENFSIEDQSRPLPRHLRERLHQLWKALRNVFPVARVNRHPPRRLRIPAVHLRPHPVILVLQNCLHPKCDSGQKEIRVPHLKPLFT